MAKFNFNARYFAEDKDIYDTLKSGRVDIQTLARIARTRGIFLSEQDEKETILVDVSTLPFNWPQLQELMRTVESPDKAEKVSLMKVQSDAEIDKVREAAEFVQSLRTAGRNEAYQITQGKDSTVFVKVNYTEFDPKNNRLMQLRHREVKIEIEKVGGKLEIRHEHTGRAVEIANRIVEALSEGKAEAPKPEQIDLSQIANPDLRTKFFTSLMSSIEGFRLVDVKEVKIDRLIPKTPEELQPEADEKEKEKKAKAEYKALVRKMALAGDGILISDEYKLLKTKGFYIAKTVWIGRENDGENRNIHFSAEFSGDEEDHKAFVYDVRWLWERDDKGDLRETRSPVSPSDRIKFLKNFESAAFKVFDEIKADAMKASEAAPEGNDSSTPKADAAPNQMA